MVNGLRAFLHPMTDDDEGATAVEYAVLLTMVTALIIVAVAFLGENTRNAFDKVSAGLPGLEDKCKGKDSEGDENCGIGND